MQAPTKADGTWQSTMTLLSSKGETRLPIGSSRIRPVYGEGGSSTCAIRILERNGQTSATVAWSDPTSCCYGEQIWRRCIAKKAGVCALSGHSHAGLPFGGSSLTVQIRLFVNVAVFATMARGAKADRRHAHHPNFASTPT
jgi:hypothetical protein